MIDLDDLAALAPRRRGRVLSVRGILIRAKLPEAHVGEICRVRLNPTHWLTCEVVGFDTGGAQLMPLGEVNEVPFDALVEPLGKQAAVPCGSRTRGRVLDALGNARDAHLRGALPSGESTELMRAAPNPLDRPLIDEALDTQIKAIDCCLPIGKGQRIGIFAGAGVGKSTLLSMLTRFVEADRVVLALIGERGREVNEFLLRDLGEAGRAKSTVVVSTSDEPALLRLRAAYTATAIAEAARDRGENVLLLMDSVTRFARALREVGLAAGELPAKGGYPPSVFATLPKLFERSGRTGQGSITAIYTVLVAGDEITREPVADEVMSLLDGHIVLSRDIGRYPAIDILQSKSRLLAALADEPQREACSWIERAYRVHAANIDKIQMNEFDPPQAIERELVDALPRVDAFLAQSTDVP
ncbi:MAG: FliI/YscN family ATPase, partial [Planctomycetes bacterium]|nr:FliI/YscN family ATPase [Planctomycetota bacterium]